VAAVAKAANAEDPVVRHLLAGNAGLLEQGRQVAPQGIAPRKDKARIQVSASWSHLLGVGLGHGDNVAKLRAAGLQICEAGDVPWKTPGKNDFATASPQVDQAPERLDGHETARRNHDRPVVVSPEDDRRGSAPRPRGGALDAGAGEKGVGHLVVGVALVPELHGRVMKRASDHPLAR